MSFTFTFLNGSEIQVDDKKYLFKGLQLFEDQLQVEEEPEDWYFEAYKGPAVSDSSKLGKAFKVWRESNFHITDINVMFDVSTKSNNDNSNKLRELLLERIFTHIPEEYFTDETYGKKWTTVRTEWHNFIKATYPDHDRFAVKRKAGRGFNYDFEITYMKDDFILQQPVEFKFNTPNLYKLPQVLSLGCLPNVFLTESYQEYFYDGALRDYVALDPGITVAIPEKSVYMKCVTSSNYDCHPFFQMLKTREPVEKDKKAEIVDKSIQTYLETYGAEIRVPEVMKKIQESQANKVFAMWHKGTFTSDNIILSPEDVTTTRFHGITKNTIRLQMPDRREFHMLLRWKNHKGVLLPAWQISLKAPPAARTLKAPKTARTVRTAKTRKSNSPKSRR
jgi:hypothetical protein